MADAVGAPQAPRKALFKPSTKTPPVRKFKSRSVKAAGTATPGTEPPKVFRSVSKSSQLSRTSSKAGGDESAKPPPETSTRSSKAESEPIKLGQDYAASDTTGETATGTVNDDVFTPDTVRSNEAPHALSRKSSEVVAADQIRPNSQDSGDTETQDKDECTPGEVQEPRFRPKPASVVSESKEGLDDEVAAPVKATRRQVRPRPVTVTTGSKDQSPQPLSDDDSAVSMGGSPPPERNDESLDADADNDGTPDVANEDAPNEATHASHIPGDDTGEATSKITSAAGDSLGKVEEGADQRDVADAQANGDTAQAPGDVPDKGTNEAPEVPTNGSVEKHSGEAVPETGDKIEKTSVGDSAEATEATPDVQKDDATNATAEGPGDAPDSRAAESSHFDHVAVEGTGHSADSAPDAAEEVGATAAEASGASREAGKVDVADEADANAETDPVVPAEDTGKVPEDASDKVTNDTNASLGGAAENPEDATRTAGSASKSDAGASVEDDTQTAPTDSDDSASKTFADAKESFDGGDTTAAYAPADGSSAGTADAPEGEGPKAVDTISAVEGAPNVSADKADAPGQDEAAAPEAEAPHVDTEDAMVDAVSNPEDADADTATGAPEADANDAAQVSAPDTDSTDAVPDADAKAPAVEGEAAETTGEKNVDSEAPEAGADTVNGAPGSDPKGEASAPIAEGKTASAADESSVGREAQEPGIDAAADSDTDTPGADVGGTAKAPEAGTEATVPVSETDPVGAGATGVDADATDESRAPAGGDEAAERSDTTVKPKSSESATDVAPEATEVGTASGAPGAVANDGSEVSASAAGAEAAEEHADTESGNAAIDSTAASELKEDIHDEAAMPVPEENVKTNTTKPSEDVAPDAGADATDTDADLAVDAAKSTPDHNADRAAGEVEPGAPEANVDVPTDGTEPAVSGSQNDTTAAEEASGTAADATANALKTSNDLAADTDKEPDNNTDVAPESGPPGTVAEAPEAGGEAPKAATNATPGAPKDDTATSGEEDVGAAAGGDVSNAQGETTQAPGADLGGAPEAGVVESNAIDATDAPGSNEAAVDDMAKDMSADALKAAADDNDAASAPKASADEPGKLARSTSGNIVRPHYVRDQVAHIESGPRPSASRKTSTGHKDETAPSVATAAPDADANSAAEGSTPVPDEATAEAGVTGDAPTGSQAEADTARESGADFADDTTGEATEKGGDESSEPVAFVVAPSGTITVDSTIDDALQKADDTLDDAEEHGDAKAGDGAPVASDKAGDGAPVASDEAGDGAPVASDKAGGVIDQSGDGVDKTEGDEPSSPTAFVVAPSGTITMDDTIEGAIEKADDALDDNAVKPGNDIEASTSKIGGAELETAKDEVGKGMGTADASEASCGATGPINDATAEPQQQGLSDSAGDLPDAVAAGHMQAADLVRYFTEHGNPEMAEFIKALTFVEAPHDAESTMAAVKDAVTDATARGQDIASDADTNSATTAVSTNKGADAAQNGAHDGAAQSPAAQMADGDASNLDADREQVAGHASGALPDGAQLPQGAAAGDATVNADDAADSATSLTGDPSNGTGNNSVDATTGVAGDAAASDATAKINANGSDAAAAGGAGNSAAEADANAPGYFDAAAEAANESTPIPAVADIFGIPGAVTLAPGGTTLPGASAVAPGSIAVPGAKDAGVTPRSAGADLIVDPPVQPMDADPVVVEESAEEPAEIVGITDVTELPPAEQGPDFEDIAAPKIEEPLPAPEIEVVAMPGDPIQAREIVDGVTLDQMTAPPPSLPDPSKAAEPTTSIPDPPNPEEVANNLHLPDHVKAAANAAQETAAPAAADNVQEPSSTPAAGGPGQGGTSRFVGLGPAAGGDAPGGMKGAAQGGGAASDDAGVSSDPPAVDNMGNPAYVSRQINIPLPRPDGATPRAKPNTKPKSDIPCVDDTNDANGLEDPPEEFLDPNIHSHKAETSGEGQETVIPSIPKIPSITSKPPENLKQLAIGLAGHTVDDVGNIVDGEGKVLGHATGDLPSMIGKMVTEGGEVYGDRGELVGYVSLNFVNPPPTEEAAPEESNTMPFPANLRIDRNGNILDGSGNIIGKLNEAPIHASTRIPAPPAPQPSADQGQLTPTERTSRTKAPPKAEADQEQTSTSKPASGDSGIPSDIFLDVKSTPEGIQLMIRIPTIFKQESR